MNEDIVYHYCSVDTFLNIIQSNVLRLTDIEKSNDYEERTYMEKLIMQELGMLLRGEELEQLVECNYHSLYSMSRLYACCFSENGDLLSQWRAYGDSGCGVAIGFSCKYLEKLNEDLYGLVFKKIEYNEDKHRIFAKNQALKILQSFRNGKNFLAAMAEVYENEVENSGCHKMSAFMEEREWRVAVAMTPECRINEGGKFQDFRVSPLKIYSARGDLITYMDLDFSEIKNDFLKSVIIGPSCKLKEQDVYTCLRLYGYQCEDEKLVVEHSDATYKV